MPEKMEKKEDYNYNIPHKFFITLIIKLLSSH